MTALIIILNLFILESLLSIDNAAVLAVMVKDLPKSDQPKALRYGLLGAFIFRGICLVLAAWLIKIMWLKILGGVYLIWLTIKHLFIEDSDPDEIKTKGFWHTVLMVEIMDLAFSIDNVFAAVALTSNIWLIMTGVFIGIVSMRFIAQWFTVLMEKFPSLNRAVFIVIFFLGLKLIVSGALEYIPGFEVLKTNINCHEFDLLFSMAMILIFGFSIVKNWYQRA